MISRRLLSRSTGVPRDPAISTCEDNGPAIQATLSNPHGLALTRYDGFLIAAALEQRIRKMSRLNGP